MKKDLKKYYDNKAILPISENEYQSFQTLSQEQISNYLFENLIKTIIFVYPPKAEYRISSTNKLKTDPSIYTGSGGNVYLYWRFYLLNKHLLSIGVHNPYNSPGLDPKKMACQEYLEISIETNLRIFESLSKENDYLLYVSPSFFMGPCGIWILAAHYMMELKDSDKCQFYINKVLEYKEIAIKTCKEEELLYGYAGYLWCLLYLFANVGTFVDNESLKSTIIELFIHIVTEGFANQKKFSLGCLAYIFPSDAKIEGPEDFYLGAAHGALGNLYVLMEAIRLVGELKSLKNYDFFEKLIINSLDYILTLQFTSGNFPSRIGKEKDLLLHFCHGSTGAIMVYVQAYSIFQKIEYLEAALKAGKDLWKRGILLKGNCTCHGIIGNAYAFHSIYRITDDKLWLAKSLHFCLFTFNKDIQLACSQYEDRTRKITGTSDSPYSLMEGMAGHICLFSDILSSNVKFPGFQL